MIGSRSALDKKLRQLETPIQIQDYLDTLKINFEKEGETLQSPKQVLETKKAHCIEAALLAAALLWAKGEKPLLLDLKANDTDDDHVVALYKENGFWGAISKSNHATLRFRDPIYKTVRELALSYFHEYWNAKTQKKTLLSYSKPFNLSKYGKEWITAKENLWYIAEELDDSPHYSLVPLKNKKLLRKADKMERRAGKITEY